MKIISQDPRSWKILRSKRWDGNYTYNPSDANGAIDNFVFEDRLEISGVYYSRAGGGIELTSITDGTVYEISQHEFSKLIRDPNKQVDEFIVTGKWTFAKRGMSLVLCYLG